MIVALGKLLLTLVFSLVFLGLGTQVAAGALPIDFELCTGTPTSYMEDGATVTAVGGDLNCTFTVSGFSGTVAFGGVLFDFLPVRTDFPAPVISVSAVMGDGFPGDIDGSVFMEAYDASDVKVAEDIVACGTCVGLWDLCRPSSCKRFCSKYCLCNHWFDN